MLTPFALVPVAQLEECRFPKPKVAGSNPVGCAKFYFRADDGIVCGNSLKRVNAFRAFLMNKGKTMCRLLLNGRHGIEKAACTS